MATGGCASPGRSRHLENMQPRPGLAHRNGAAPPPRRAPSRAFVFNSTRSLTSCENICTPAHGPEDQPRSSCHVTHAVSHA